ncbi:MAG: tetratricopeptide repeat protein, partial [Bacteroidota bacterium]
MKWRFFFFPSLVFLLIAACTSKTVEEVPKVEATKVVKAQAPKVIDLSPCKHWVGQPFEDEALELHVLYRDDIRYKKYEAAFDRWKKVYELAPAADGQRDVHYVDGARIYKHFYFYKKDATAEEKETYKQKVFELYEQAIDCYPKKASSYKAVIAYDYFYTFPGSKSSEEIYQMYKEIVDADDLKTSVSVLNPFTSLIVNLLLEEKITMAEAQKYSNKVKAVFGHNKEKLTATEWKKSGWDIVESYMPRRLEQLEGIEDFYDCQYYKDKYTAEYEAAGANCDEINSYVGRLRWGKCPADDGQLLAALDNKKQNCYVPPPPPGLLRQAKDALENARYKEAISFYEEYISKNDDPEKKAKYLLRIGKIYFAHLKSFSKSRQYARKALEQKPNW